MIGRMKNKYILYVFIFFISVFGFSINVFSEDNRETVTDVSIDTVVLNKYVWRGLLLTDDPVFHTGITATYEVLSFNLWSNMDIGDVNANKNEVNEIDFTFDYSFNVKSFLLTAGIIHYAFPHTDFSSTTELYIGLNSQYTKDASFKIYQDIGESDGTYISLGYSSKTHVIEAISVDIGGAVNFGTSKNNQFYYGKNRASLTDFLIGMNVPLEIGKYVSVTPVMTFTSIIDSNIRDMFDDTDTNSDNLVFGVALSSSFSQ